MNILILYFGPIKINSIKDHLFSFKNYTNNNCFYWDCRYQIPETILSDQLDCIILHTTFLCIRYSKNLDELIKTTSVLDKYNVPVIALPQDEYDRNLLLNNWLKSIKNLYLIGTNFISQKNTLYKHFTSENVKFIPVFPAYIDNKTIELVKKQSVKKEIDICYRANKLGYWFGFIGNIKVKLSSIFDGIAYKYPDLKIDVNTKDSSILKGDDWILFLLKSRCILGCESGSSILIETADDYSDNSESTFEPYKFYTISGRHFEAALTKTCQLLVEGEYEGILKPWIHYIPIKKNFDNLDEVISKVKDIGYCKQLAEKTYNDIVKSDQYSYKHFVHKILSNIPSKKEQMFSIFKYKLLFYFTLGLKKLKIN